jgi:hypothetical protein
MNNNLKALSNNELRCKRNDLAEAEKFINIQLKEKSNLYNKKLSAFLTNPVNLLALSSDIAALQKCANLLDEYSKTLLDELNLRSRNS